MSSENTVDSTIDNLPNEVTTIQDDDQFVIFDVSEPIVNAKTKKVTALNLQTYAGGGIWSRNSGSGLIFPTTLTDKLTVGNDFTVDTNTLFVDATNDTVSIGNTASLTDLTIFQQTANSKKGITLAGEGVGGNDTTDGIVLLIGNNTINNRQLWVGQQSDVGNSAKNFFRYIVGGAVPTIDGVNGDNTVVKHINLGGLGGNIGIGFNVGATSQGDIVGQLHIKPNATNKIGSIIQAFGTQTVDLFQVRNSAGVAQVVIDENFKMGIGILDPLATLHIRSSDAGILTLNGDADDFIIENNGNTGYTIAPTVVISPPPTPVTATATSTITGDAVTSVTIVIKGSGYVTTPTVTFSGGGGTGATATAVLVNTEVIVINLTAGGSGYTSAPTVTLTAAPAAVTATGTANISGGKVVSVTITNAGVGYKIPPALVQFTGGDGNGVGTDTVTVGSSGITSITVTNGGTGLSIVSDSDQVGVISFTHGGATDQQASIVQDHNTERMRFLQSGQQGLIIDSLGHVAVSQDNVDHPQVFTVDTDVLNVPVRMLIRDSLDRLMVGYNGVDGFLVESNQAQVIVPKDTGDLMIAGRGNNASNIKFLTSPDNFTGGLRERMTIQADGKIIIGGGTIFNPIAHLVLTGFASPTLEMIENPQNTDNKIWVNSIANGKNIHSILNDARTTGIEYMRVTRSNIPYSITDIEFITPQFSISGNVGIGVTIPRTKFDVVSTASDLSPVLTTETTGTNGGITQTFVGDQDPNGVVTGAGGAEYIRDSGVTSKRYLSREATTGTAWDEVSTNPPNLIEIKTASDFDALASGGIVTISTNTTLFLKATIVTANRIVINSGIILHITAGFFHDKDLVYTGTGTFITTAGGTFRLVANAGLVASSTGTLTSFTGTGTFFTGFSALIGWNSLGTFADGRYIGDQTLYFNIAGGLTLTNPTQFALNQASFRGTTFTGTYFTVNSNNPDTVISIGADLQFASLASTATAFSFSTKLNNSLSINISDIALNAGNLFKQGDSPNATINSVVDASPAAGTITAFADDVTGVSTTVSSTTTYFEDEEVTISGTTSYNGTFQIFGVVAAVSFKIRRAFVADDATGSIASNRIDMTLAASHGVTAGMSIKVINTQFYNMFYTVLNLTGDVITLNNTFVSTNTGTIERNVGLDETDPRINAQNNGSFPDSHNILTAYVNNNSTANGTIVNNTFTDIVFGTVGDALIAGSTMENWKMIDEINGIFEYLGNHPFDGAITFDFSVTSTAEQDFRFKWVIDTGSGFGNLPDNVEALVNLKDTGDNVSKTFPLKANKGDKIKPQITRNAGSAGITTMYATVFAGG